MNTHHEVFSVTVRDGELAFGVREITGKEVFRAIFTKPAAEELAKLCDKWPGRDWPFYRGLLSTERFILPCESEDPTPLAEPRSEQEKTGLQEVLSKLESLIQTMEDIGVARDFLPQEDWLAIFYDPSDPRFDDVAELLHAWQDKAEQRVAEETAKKDAAKHVDRAAEILRFYRGLTPGELQETEGTITSLLADLLHYVQEDMTEKPQDVLAEAVDNAVRYFESESK